MPVSFRRPTRTQNRVTINRLIMREYVVLFSIVTLTINTYGQDRGSPTTGLKNKTLHITGVEVPNSPLLLLDRMNLREVSSMAINARQNVEPNSTTSASSSSSSSSSRPCTCSFGVCKCCTGLIMDLFNQKACMKITYNPGDFAFDVAMSINDRVLYENSLSGKNPRPICISPPRLNNLKMCAKFYNVFFPGRNFHFCLAMTGQWRSFELYNMAFDCLRMGADGVAIIKPDDAGGLVIPNPQGGVDAVIDHGDDIEDYDENLVKSLLNVFDDDDR